MSGPVLDVQVLDPSVDYIVDNNKVIGSVGVSCIISLGKIEIYFATPPLEPCPSQ